jgi:hypothetical protein
MASPRSERVVRLLATARSNPEFAARLVAELPASARASLIEELAKPAAPPEAPRLRKCQAPAAADWGTHTDYSAQLNLFARRSYRVG